MANHSQTLNDLETRRDETKQDLEMKEQSLLNIYAIRDHYMKQKNKAQNDMGVGRKALADAKIRLEEQRAHVAAGEEYVAGVEAAYATAMADFQAHDIGAHASEGITAHARQLAEAAENDLRAERERLVEVEDLSQRIGDMAVEQLRAAEGSKISRFFTHIIFYGGKWRVFACGECGANAQSGSAAFLNGTMGFYLHYTQSHGVGSGRPEQILDRCESRELSSADAGLLAQVQDYEGAAAVLGEGQENLEAPIVAKLGSEGAEEEMVL